MTQKIEVSRKYNPDGSLLRRDQKELLQLLLVVDKICRKNGIPYWLSSGTLLGAARHKGFIPWDDDIDIVLLKKDMKRLENILKKYQSEEYVYHCLSTDYNYLNVFGKFRKRIETVNITHKRHQYYKWKGIGIDIFAIEKINGMASKVGNRFYHKAMKLTDFFVNCQFVRHILIRCIQFLCFYFLFPILRLLGRYNPHEEYHYVLGTGWAEHTFYMQDTFPLMTAEFEGVQLPVPNNMDSYLTNVYGDWHRIPNDDEIKKTIHCQDYKDEIYHREK